VGCGTGVLTVLMKLLGFDVTGVDVHRQHVQLARVLAEENGLSPDMFVWHQDEELPFPDKSFDIVTMISVLEHLDDTTLGKLAPELARVCQGLLFVQAPNSASIRDDHTGLLFVPSMPRWFARAYVAMWGKKYRYHISASGSWDVHYRSFDRAIRSFQPYFEFRPSPRAFCYPPTPLEYSPTWMGKGVQLFNQKLFLGVPLPWRRIKISRGYPEEAYHPYLNIIFKPRNARGEN